MSKHTYLSGSAVLILLPLIAGCTGKQTGTTTVAQDAAPVETVSPERGSLRKILAYTAAVNAWDEREIVPDIAGKIRRIYVEEGDRVRKGQVLAELDTESLHLSLAQAEANLHAAEANLKDAERNDARMQELFRTDTITPQQREKAELARAAASAQVEQAKAAAELIRYNIRMSVMKAPYDGVITRKGMREGDVINPAGGAGVVTLIDLSRLKISILVPDTDLPDLKPGMPVSIRADAYPGREFMGAIRTVIPAARDNKRLFEVQAVIPNSGMELKPGMFVRVSIMVGERRDVLVLPLTCVLSPKDTPFVFVVENGLARKREIGLGMIEDQRVEITAGLQGGERVVSVGQTILADGAAVKTSGGEEE